MNETTMTIVGNVLNEPECRLLQESQQLVTNFKVAATSRRYDRQEERWVDGDSLRMRVTCWRQLAENVARSVRVGDPVIVTGRLSSKTWEGEDHVKRTSYELDAATVGHDLTRGRARFARVRASTATTTIDDELSESRIAGQLATPVTSINDLPRRRDFDSELGGFVTTVGVGPDSTRDPFAEDVLRELDEAVSAAFDEATRTDTAKYAQHDAAVDFAARAVAFVASQPSGGEQETSGGEEETSDGTSDPDEAPADDAVRTGTADQRRRSRANRVPVGV